MDPEKINPETLLDWPVTIIKCTNDNLVLRDLSGAEIQITASDSKLVFERIW